MPVPSAFPSIAVLTGDVVASSRLRADVRADLRMILRSAAHRVKDHFGEAIPFPVDVFRGDSWQLVVMPPKHAFRAALYLRAVLRFQVENERLDTRIAIGIGRANFIPPENVSSGDGEAFRLSGTAMEQLGRSRRMTIAMPLDRQSGAESALPIVAGLVDELARRWTAKQARAVGGAIRGLTQEAIGAKWSPTPVSQQAIAQHLDGAGWNAIDDAIAFFEKLVGSLTRASHTPPERASEAGADAGTSTRSRDA